MFGSLPEVALEFILFLTAGDFKDSWWLFIAKNCLKTTGSCCKEDLKEICLRKMNAILSINPLDVVLKLMLLGTKTLPEFCWVVGVGILSSIKPT